MSGTPRHRPPPPDSTFAAVLVDWEAVAVPHDREAQRAVGERLVDLASRGVEVGICTRTALDPLDAALGTRPTGPGRVHVFAEGGDQTFVIGAGGPELVESRSPSDDEAAAVRRGARQTVDALGARGVEATIVADHPGRQVIDLVGWDPVTLDGDLTASAEAVTARLASAGIGSLATVMALARRESRAAGLRDPRVTSDVVHLEVALTDRSDSARWFADRLGGLGITGALVLVIGRRFGPAAGAPGADTALLVAELARAAAVSVGDEPGGVPRGVVALGGGPGRVVELLEAQVERHRARRVPGADLDPAWVVELPATSAAERVAESLGTLANGFAGTRGSWEEDGHGASPLFVVSGVYGDHGFLAGPVWTGLELTGGRRRSGRRWLDLRTGMLVRRGNGLSTVRLVSAAEPYALALRAEGRAGRLAPGPALTAPPGGPDMATTEDGPVTVGRTGAPGGAIAVAARQQAGTAGSLATVERLAAWATDGEGDPAGAARRRLDEVAAAGFDVVVAAHRRAWARRWADAEVVIDGAPDDQLAARFAVFHLLSAAADAGETAVGPRAMTGTSYAGHVFWDTDAFVLPALAALHPGAARAILEYRIRRLPAARAAATEQGRRGARFPWESAADGTDVTPGSVVGRRGQVFPVVTGTREEHITADVAWAAAHYAAWTGDGQFLAGVGRDLVVETARYWASRIRLGDDGLGHLEGVMGPDEYHEVVDDNAYTNVMARWNLRAGADLVAGTDRAEAERWRDLADTMADGWDPARGIYEQFAGYFELEPLLMSEVAPPPVAVDVLLGRDRVAGSQLLKQADVLMLHHLVPAEVVGGSLTACLDFYEPRTAHGSSLSPAIHASLLARAGEPDRALELFRVASRLDLDDLTGTTSGGLHLATMGGVWQALAFGFLGLSVADGVLRVDPVLPGAWGRLGLALRVGGQRVEVQADHERVEVRCEAPLAAARAGGAVEIVRPPGGALEPGPAPDERSRP
ncbi:MAG TPA: glycosyl hydrolase family 65 protein [Acidimicrobiales bacterium]|nr:glycosyl hydrolase family 65 protein [Acidimicrobiales bacterium]